MDKKYWWFTSFIICIVLLGIVSFFWYREVTFYKQNLRQLDSKAAVKDYLEKNIILGENKEKYIFVPTGVFIQSLEFVNASDVNITGYIWQKYTHDLPNDISRGFIFPEQVQSGDTFISKEYHRKNGHYEVTGWYFDVTLRQPFDYSKYPLDKHDIWIRIWHADFDRNVILLPDLVSYDKIPQGEVFGIDYDMVAGQWIIHETYFEYKNGEYDTDFGISDNTIKKGLPELFFTINVGRRFTDAFIINLIPLITVSFMLFFVLLTVTSDKEKLEILGFSVSGAIGTAATLFFVIILAHIQVRKQFSGDGIVYIEQFYFIIYSVILLLSLDVYFFSTNCDKDRRGPISYNDNFIPKVLFWPAIISAITIATVIYF